MTARVVRDWRGLKFKVSEYSTAELIALRAHTVHVQSQVERFIGEIDEELVGRALSPWLGQSTGDRSNSATTNQGSAGAAAPQGENVTSLHMAGRLANADS